MTIKEEIQIEEYKRTFAEAYKQGFMDAINMCKTEPQTITMVKDHGRKQALEMINLYHELKTEPQTKRK